MANRGRPKIDLDEGKILALASLGLTYGEIASVMGCAISTLERNCDGVIKEGHEKRNASLRRKQYEIAMSGNPTLLIWLGKQYLGQADKTQNEHSGPDGGPMQVMTLDDFYRGSKSGD